LFCFSWVMIFCSRRILRNFLFLLELFVHCGKGVKKNHWRFGSRLTTDEIRSKPSLLLLPRQRFTILDATQFLSVNEGEKPFRKWWGGKSIRPLCTLPLRRSPLLLRSVAAQCPFREGGHVRWRGRGHCWQLHRRLRHRHEGGTRCGSGEERRRRHNAFRRRGGRPLGRGRGG